MISLLLCYNFNKLYSVFCVSLKILTSRIGLVWPQANLYQGLQMNPTSTMKSMWQGGEKIQQTIPQLSVMSLHVCMFCTKKLENAPFSIRNIFLTKIVLMSTPQVRNLKFNYNFLTLGVDINTAFVQKIFPIENCAFLVIFYVSVVQNSTKVVKYQ